MVPRVIILLNPLSTSKRTLFTAGEFRYLYIYIYWCKLHINIYAQEEHEGLGQTISQSSKLYRKKKKFGKGKS